MRFITKYWYVNKCIFNLLQFWGIEEDFEPNSIKFYNVLNLIESWCGYMNFIKSLQLFIYFKILYVRILIHSSEFSDKLSLIYFSGSRYIKIKGLDLFLRWKAWSSSR